MRFSPGGFLVVVLIALALVSGSPARAQEDDDDVVSPESKASPVVPVSLPKDALVIEVPDEANSILLSGRRYDAPFSKPGDVRWFTFGLDADQVILLGLIGNTSEHRAHLELFDASGVDPAPDRWSTGLSGLDRFFNGRIRKGKYFVRVTCESGCSMPATIYVMRFGPDSTRTPAPAL